MSECLIIQFVCIVFKVNPWLKEFEFCQICKFGRKNFNEILRWAIFRKGTFSLFKVPANLTCAATLMHLLNTISQPEIGPHVRKDLHLSRKIKGRKHRRWKTTDTFILFCCYWKQKTGSHRKIWELWAQMPLKHTQFQAPGLIWKLKSSNL